MWAHLLADYARVARFLLIGDPGLRYDLVSFRCLHAEARSHFPPFSDAVRRGQVPGWLWLLEVPAGWPRSMSDPVQLCVRDHLGSGLIDMLFLPLHRLVPRKRRAPAGRANQPKRQADSRRPGLRCLFDAEEFTWGPPLAASQAPTADEGWAQRAEDHLRRVRLEPEGLQAVWLDGEAQEARLLSCLRPDVMPGDLATFLVSRYNALDQLVAGTLDSGRHVGLLAVDGLLPPPLPQDAQASDDRRCGDPYAYQRLCLLRGHRTWPLVPQSVPCGSEGQAREPSPFLVYALAQCCLRDGLAPPLPGREEFAAVRRSLDGSPGSGWFSVHISEAGDPSLQRFLAEPPLVCFGGAGLKTWRGDAPRRSTGVTVYLELSTSGLFYVHNHNTDAFTHGCLASVMPAVLSVGRLFADFYGISVFNRQGPAD